jgi:hypothetical protein
MKVWLRVVKGGCCLKKFDHPWVKHKWWTLVDTVMNTRVAGFKKIRKNERIFFVGLNC